jgi:peptide-methionine (R)-S-oxide reductase
MQVGNEKVRINIERDMKLIVVSSLVVALVGCAVVGATQSIKMKGVASESPKRKDKVVKADAEWKKLLPKEQYEILRNKGTEPAFCGVNLGQKGNGVYHCVGCDLALFEANKKFDSGTGWPSFFMPIANDRIWFHEDKAYGMSRTEVLCARCDGHLGHVFDDGPEPSGLRFCMNGKVLKFNKGEKAK